ncbi:unnamed protein product [Laminaria digitata]
MTVKIIGLTGHRYQLQYQLPESGQPCLQLAYSLLASSTHGTTTHIYRKRANGCALCKAVGVRSIHSASR